MTVIQPTMEIAPGITIPIGPPTTVPVVPPAPAVRHRPRERPSRDRRRRRDRRRSPPTSRRGGWPTICAPPTTGIARAAPTFWARRCRNVVGGPVGRHAIIGRTRIMTPLRVMFLIALVFLALGWSTKAPCLQTVGTGPGDQRVANWQNQRAYYELCYSDTVPLYGAELLSQGRFPYKSSWIEKDASGKPQTRYDGQPAVRYMEYPVLTGVYQYVSMSLAKTYTAVSKMIPLPVVAEVVVFFDVSALGLALAWLATLWATAGLAGRRVWDAALVAASPLVIFQIFTNFDALATALALGGLLAWARRRPVLAGSADRSGRRGQAVSAVAAGPVAGAGHPDRTVPRGGPHRGRGVGDVVAGEPAGDGALSAGLVGVLPAQRPSR